MGWPPVPSAAYQGSQTLPPPGVGILRRVRRELGHHGELLSVDIEHDGSSYEAPFRPPQRLLASALRLLGEHLHEDIGLMARLEVPESV
jgi:hypothetical protein